MTQLDPALDRALRAFAGPGRILVALDFDGTLAPIAERPGAVRTLPASHAAIERLLALPETAVAYVSGRSLESLVEAAQPPAGSLLVGSHGIEVRWEDGVEPLALRDEERERTAALHALLEEVAARHDGVWVEDKPAGSALHTRQADREVARRAEQEAAALIAERLPGLTSRGGKRILEFAVRDATKGDGVELLRRHVGADRVLYGGDDLTDEDAFAVLRPDDVGIKSGPGPTRATYRVAGPEEFADALVVLAAARAGA